MSQCSGNPLTEVFRWMWLIPEVGFGQTKSRFFQILPNPALAEEALGPSSVLWRCRHPACMMQRAPGISHSGAQTLGLVENALRIGRGQEARDFPGKLSHVGRERFSRRFQRGQEFGRRCARSLALSASYNPDAGNA